MTLFWAFLFLLTPIASCDGLEIIFQRFILDYFNQNRVNSVTVFTCNDIEAINLNKKLSTSGILSNSFNLKNFIFQENVLSTFHYQLGLIVDVSCDQANDFLKKASKREGLFNSLHHWLLLHPQSEISEDFWNSLKGVRLDSHVSLLTLQGDPPEGLLVHDIYRIGGTRTQLEVFNMEWTPGQKIPSPASRNDFKGTQLIGSIVNTESEWDQWWDYNVRHIDTLSKLAHVIILHLGKLLNYKAYFPREKIYPTWGFTKKNGSFIGMLGAISRHEADVGTGCVHRKYRYDIVGYTQFYSSFCPRFIFRRPPISATNNIYGLAFSMYVWVTFGVLCIVSAIVLCVTEYFGDSDHDFEDHDGWFDFFFVSFSIISQQGATASPGKISSRLVFWSLLILAVIFDNSFSASIVVLLQSSNEDIKTFANLFYSPFRFIMQDIEWNTFYVNVTTSTLERRLFREKVFTQPWDKAFVTIEEGVRQVRKGMVAFHVDVASNKYIESTFEEGEKCSLKELFMYPCEPLYLPVQKWSPYKEHFQQKLILFNEVGITERENSFYYTAFPKCYENSIGFVSVSLQDFQPAILIFVYGVILAVLIAIVEIVYVRLKRSRAAKRRKRIS